MNYFYSLMFNIFLNFAIILVYILSLRFLSFKGDKGLLKEKLISGLLFALGVLVTMKYPLKISEGIFIDSRVIYVILPTLLFGEISGIFPMATAIIYRAYISGKGEVGGILLIVCAYTVSLFFYYYIQKKGKLRYIHIYLASLVTHLLMALLIFIFVREYFSIPSAKIILFLTILIFPVVTTVMGVFILESQKWEKLKNEAEFQKNYLNTLLNNISEIVISLNKENKITFANKNATTFFNNKKLTGKDWRDIISIYDKNKNEITDSILRQVKNKENIELKDCYIKKGVRFVPIAGSLSPLLEHGQKTSGYLLTFTDISEKIEREKLLSEILERVSDGVESYDKNWNYTFANNQAAKLLNRKSSEELIGKNKWKLDPEVIGTPFYNACMKAFKTQKTIFMEHYYKPWDRWFENRIYPSENGVTVFFSDITERKRLEEKINKINRNLQTTFKLNPAIIFVWDADERKTLFVSDNIETILGYPKEETMKDNWWRGIVHKDDFENALLKSDMVFVDGKSEHQFRVFKKDGSLAWVFEKQIMVRDKESQKRIVYGTWIDITELVKISEELKEQQEIFKNLFENEFVPMLLIDTSNMQIIDANQAASRLYGYSQKELKGKLTLHDLHNEETDFKKLKEANKPVINFEAIHKKAEGEEVFVEIYIIPFTKKGKELAFAIIHDISEKKQMEKELIESESRFYLAFQSSPIATAISSLSEGKFVDVNPAFEKISGYSKQEIIGKTSIQLNLWANPEERKGFIEKLRKQKVVLNQRVTFQNRKGEKVFSFFTAFILKEDLMFSYVIDITELVKLQNELEIKVRERTTKLEELNEELKEFTQSLVHDLKEPLRTIKNFSEMILQEEKSTPASLKKNLSFIYSASQHLEKMVNELYEYSKLGKETFTLSMVSLDRAMDNVFKMLQTLIKETCTEITIPEELGMVYGNNALITRILQNLIDNAIKFRREGVKPKITITSTKTRSTLTLTISDNGKGIKKDYLNKVFYPFAKAGNEDNEGLGMGLAIVKKSMEIMGGEVKIKSDLNQGTQVSLIFRI